MNNDFNLPMMNEDYHGKKNIIVSSPCFIEQPVIMGILNQNVNTYLAAIAMFFVYQDGLNLFANTKYEVSIAYNQVPDPMFVTTRANYVDTEATIIVLNKEHKRALYFKVQTTDPTTMIQLMSNFSLTSEGDVSTKAITEMSGFVNPLNINTSDNLLSIFDFLEYGNTEIKKSVRFFC